MVEEGKKDESSSIKQHKGRSIISNSTRTGSSSKRALKGGLEVIYRTCPHCNHHKAFVNTSGTIKCSKCKRVNK